MYSKYFVLRFCRLRWVSCTGAIFNTIVISLNCIKYLCCVAFADCCVVFAEYGGCRRVPCEGTILSTVYIKCITYLVLCWCFCRLRRMSRAGGAMPGGPVDGLPRVGHGNDHHQDRKVSVNVLNHEPEIHLAFKRGTSCIPC